jgi:hypothetical protein
MLLSELTDGKGCCSTDEETGLIFDETLFRDKGDLTKSLNLSKILIPSTEYKETRKTLSKGSIFSCDSNKVYALTIADNKELYVRQINKYRDDPYTLNYTLSLKVYINDSTLSQSKGRIEFSFVPDDQIINPNWNNFENLLIANGLWSTWQDIGISWYDAREHRLSNTAILPTITKTVDITLSKNVDDIFTFNKLMSLETDYFKFGFNLQFTANPQNFEFEVGISSPNYTGDFFGDKISVLAEQPLFGYTDSEHKEMMATSFLFLYSQSIKRYKKIKSILINSFANPDEKLEILNQDTNSVKCILLECN